MRRFEPRTAPTKRSRPNAIITRSHARMGEKRDTRHVEFETHLKRYVSMARRLLAEDIAVTVVIQSCVKEPRYNCESPRHALQSGAIP